MCFGLVTVFTRRALEQLLLMLAQEERFASELSACEKREELFRLKE